MAASGMESLASLARRQIDADRVHGFPAHLPDGEARCNQLSKDLVGLMGEIGEFANLLRATRGRTSWPRAGAADGACREAQIYLLRLAHLTCRSRGGGA
jgi:hypothetical protein